MACSSRRAASNISRPWVSSRTDAPHGALLPLRRFCAQKPKLKRGGVSAMSVFISYARSTAAQAGSIAALLQSHGYDVWWDADLPAHRDYADVIEERLAAAKAVLVLWSAEAVKSQWVRSEADRARTDRKLVQLSLDSARLPMPFDRIQCADLDGWSG